MTVFTLVHGGLHGAWCWDRLVPALEARGHDAVAMDLPVSDAVGADAYAAAVLDAVAPIDEDLVVVGHSLMGATIPLVAAARPVHALVYLCAVIPEPGRSVADVSAEQLDFPGSRLDAALQSVDAEGRLVPAGVDAARAMFWSDCPDDVAAWGYPLLRPQHMAPMTEVSPMAAWPDVRSHVIVCERDPLAPPAWVRHRAQTHLGVEPIELPGGHSPFLSRPDDLADVLVTFAAT